MNIWRYIMNSVPITIFTIIKPKTMAYVLIKILITEDFDNQYNAVNLKLFIFNDPLYTFTFSYSQEIWNFNRQKTK